MNAKSDFYLNKLRCEVAMQQALQEWQPKPKTYGMECPSTALFGRKSNIFNPSPNHPAEQEV
jgi:hypothetical protein